MLNPAKSTSPLKDVLMLQFPSSAFYLLSSLFFYNSVQVLLQYNEGLLSKQERCKHFIIRQLEVSGRDVTEEEVNEMVATGKWEVFNENLLNDARITRSQLSEIEQRHKVRQSCCRTDAVVPMQCCWDALRSSCSLLFEAFGPLWLFKGLCYSCPKQQASLNAEGRICWKKTNGLLKCSSKFVRSLEVVFAHLSWRKQLCWRSDGVPPRNVLSTFLPTCKESNLVGDVVVGVMLTLLRFVEHPQQLTCQSND